MHNFVYLFALLGGVCGLAFLDAKYRLVVWRAPRRALSIIVPSLVFFLTWDLLGIGLRIFSIGDARYMTHVQLLPNLPLEEPIFLLLLIYQTLILWEGLRRYSHAR